MQQIPGLRRRWGDREQWVRLGVLSASVVAPLLSRWNELRAAERTRDLKAQAEARLRELREGRPRGRRGTQRQIEEIVRQVTDVADDAATQKASSKLWLVGVAVGLIAAGGAAYVIVRRQLSLRAEEPLVELQVASVNGHGAASPQTRLNGRGGTATPATTPPTATPATSAGAAPAERTAPASADGAVSALAEQAAAPEAAAPEAIPGPAPALEEYDGMQDAATARYIGNIHTMVYHEADAAPDELPAEENRIYFLTEAEARAAGFHRDREEVAPAAEAEGQAGE